MKRALIFLPAGLALAGLAALAFRPGVREAPPKKRAVAARPAESRVETGRSRPELVAEIFAAAAEAPAWRILVERLRRSLADLSEEDLLDVRRRLARLLEEDPARARDLAALFAEETSEDLLLILADVLGADPAATADPAVLESMIRIAGEPGLASRRGGALQFLLRLPAADARAAEAAFRVAGSEEEPRELRMAALAAAAAWMQNHPEGEARHSGAVLEVARAARDPEVRGHAIQALALLDRPAAAGTVEALAPFLRDASAENRGLAAMALGGAGQEARAAAAGHLEAAISQERSAALARGMLIHAVRAAGPEAGDLLRRIGERSPALAADARDYLEILRTERDPLRVWEEKQKRDFARGAVAGADEHTD